jgi:transposase InsO family protein
MRLDPGDIVKKLKENKGKIRQTARDLGISPSTVINWHQRAKTGLTYGYLKHTGLKRLSTAPKTKRSTSLTPEQQDSVTKLRREAPLGAIKITSELALPCSHRTVHRFLKNKGLTQDYGFHRRPLFQDTKHMHAKNVTTLGKLQMDVKVVTPQLSGLDHTCYLYAVMDILSRYKLGVIFPLLDQSFAIGAIKGIVEVLPFTPDFIQTDNGLEFQAHFHAVVTQQLKLEHHYIHKSSPNENAVIERSFRTDEEEFFFFYLHRWGRPQDLSDLNEKYLRYLTWYNEKRPHLSLKLLTPLQSIQSVQ